MKGRIGTKPLPHPEHPCGKCGKPTTNIGYCGGCNAEYWAIQDARDQLKRRGTRRQDFHDMTRRRLLLEGYDMDSKALMAIPESAMLARIDRAKFPQALAPEEKKTLAMAAITYGFDPLMGELSIFQGRPFVTIDGRYRKAQETGRFDGVCTRPATKAEREEWEIPAGDFFFRAEVRVKGASFPFVGWGRVRAQERTDGGKFKPVDVNPQRMAEKRAEAQALRKAFSIPLPSAENIGEDDSDGLPSVPPFVPGTGEVIEGECREVPAESTAEVPPTSEAKSGELTWPHFANIGEMMTFGSKHGVLTQEFASFLGVKHVAEYKGTPDQAWSIIAQKKGLKPEDAK